MEGFIWLKLHSWISTLGRVRRMFYIARNFSQITIRDKERKSVECGSTRKFLEQRGKITLKKIVEWFLLMTTNSWLVGEEMWLFLRICTANRIVYHFDFQEIDQHNRAFQDRFDHMDNEEHRKNSIGSEYSKKQTHHL